jgi:predicted alpha/beta superfamily hydrolase
VVGTPRDATLAEFVARRNYEFSPNRILFYKGPGPLKFYGQDLTAAADTAGGAPLFLDFLTDQVMPLINRAYRTDSFDQGLAGASGGGMFAAYALFAKPGAFQEYIIGSPSLNTGNFLIFKMEEEYAAQHDDLPASVYISAGGAETDDIGLSVWGIVSSAARMAETLRIREYPSLHLEFRIYEGLDHMEASHLSFDRGVRALWGDGRRTPPIAEASK